MDCDAILAEDGLEQLADVLGGGAFRDPVRFVGGWLSYLRDLVYSK